MNTSKKIANNSKKCRWCSKEDLKSSQAKSRHERFCKKYTNACSSSCVCQGCGRKDKRKDSHERHLKTCKGAQDLEYPISKGNQQSLHEEISSQEAHAVTLKFRIQLRLLRGKVQTSGLLREASKEPMLCV